MKNQISNIKYQNYILKFKNFGLYIVILIFALCILHLFPTPAYAACVDPKEGVKIGECFGFDIKSLGSGTTLLVNPIFSIAAAAVVIYFLLGAFKYLKSEGNKEEVAAARQMIIHAIIGFIILMFAFFVLQFLLLKLFDISGFGIF